MNDLRTSEHHSDKDYLFLARAGTLLLLVLSVQGLASARQTSSTSRVQEFLQTLSSPTLANRSEAAKQLVLAADPSTVAGLLYALNREPDVNVRTNLVTALGRIGQPATAASQTLIRAFADPEDAVRQSAALALALIYQAHPDDLLAMAGSNQPPEMRLGFVRTFSYLGPKAIGAAQFLLSGLENDTTELFTESEIALARLGDGAKDPLVAALRHSAKVSQQQGAAWALGHIYLGLGANAPADVVQALAAVVGRSSKAVEPQAAAAGALTQMKASSPGAIQALLVALQAGDTSSIVRVRAIDALQASGVGTPEVVHALTTAVADQDDKVVGQAITALATLGPVGVSVLATTLNRCPTPDCRRKAADSLGQLGQTARGAVPALVTALDDSDDDVSASASAALGHIGQDAVWSIPHLSQLLETRTSDVRSEAALALGNLAVFVTPPRDSTALPYLQATLKELRLRPVHAADVDLETAINLPIEMAVARIEAQQRQRQTTLVAAAASSLAAAVTILFLSARVQRRLRIIVGQRWILGLGQADLAIEVVASPSGTSITHRPTNSAASTVIRQTTGWPPSQDILAVLNQSDDTPSAPLTIRIEVERARFAYPWARSLGAPWSRGATVAGQVCVTSDQIGTPRRGSKVLAFTGLSCAVARDPLPRLGAAVSEVTTVNDIFRRWGAQAGLPKHNASVAEFLTALTQADVLHVSAHASQRALFLSDGTVTHAELPERFLAQIRCRLLVLSACNAGQLTEDGAFLWQLVRTGVNIVAALSPVQDRTCETFFEEFYGALLPKRGGTGLQFAKAANVAAKRCAERFQTANRVFGMAINETNWQRTIDSFILYGDPTLQLKLQRPPTS